MSGISVATIKSPEFININSISPLVSKCEIKVLYVGQNRNRSFISKEVATEIAQTLPGVPIVGYYSDKAEDFRDHGDQITIDGDGIKINCLTKPYGFVAPDAKVWFQEFEDTDDFGNKTIREYLMCTGYLWTEQYEEAKKIINEGRPHSMELDDNTLKGHWSTDNKTGIDFFIINDAVISKLCTLGVDVEPCFEGSSITAPQISASFTKDDKEFTKTLFTMMKELKDLIYSLNNKGGETMQDEVVIQESAEVVEDEVKTSENFSAEQDENNSENNPEIHDNVEEFEKKKDEEVEETEEEKEDNEEEDDKKKEAKTKNTLEVEYEELNQKYTELQSQYELLVSENAELVKFRNTVVNQQKDDLINSFYVLSDEDKKDVIENKEKYSLEEIKSKLAVICWEKKVNFTVNDEAKGEEAAPLTFNLNTAVSENSDLPAWLRAVEANKRNSNN